MFTGIVTHQSQILEISPIPTGKLIRLAIRGSFPKTAVGDSLSVNGVCSTILEVRGADVLVQYMTETLIRTSIGKWQVGQVCSLEWPITMQTPLGGHMVSGHIDDVGIIRMRPDDSTTSRRLDIGFSNKWRPFLIPKGSVAIDGLSLTVGEVESEWFSVYLIDHTWTHTHFRTFKNGDAVNLEFDQLAKYVVQYAELYAKR